MNGEDPAFANKQKTSHDRPEVELGCHVVHPHLNPADLK